MIVLKLLCVPNFDALVNYNYNHTFKGQMLLFVVLYCV